MSHPIGYSVVVQLLVLGLLSMIALPFGWVAVYSLGIGGFVYAIPNLYFTYSAFRFQFNGSNPVTAQIVVHSLRRGAWGKFVLVALGFALVFRWVAPLNEALLFVGFFCMVILQWYLAIHISNKWAQFANRVS